MWALTMSDYKETTRRKREMKDLEDREKRKEQARGMDVKRRKKREERTRQRGVKGVWVLKKSGYKVARW